MMKGNLKSFTAGAVVATMLMSTVAFGKTYREQLDAVYNDIKLKVNGVSVTPKDVNGNTVDPFIVAGTTYLPVRALAGALGQPVDWDAENNTVLIGTTTPPPPVKDGFISIREYVDGGAAYSGRVEVKDIEPFNVFNEQYSGSNILDMRGTFLLRGGYKRLTGQYAVPDKLNTSDDITIIADGETIFSERFRYGDEVIDVDIDLTGVHSLEVRTNYWSSLSSRRGLFFNVQIAPI